MAGLGRAFVGLLIAAFAAWSVVQVASTTAMHLEMAALIADGDTLDMADCSECESGQVDSQSGPACKLVCVSPVVADLPSIGEFRLTLKAVSHSAQPVHALAGRTYPPEPHPPRVVLLI